MLSSFFKVKNRGWQILSGCQSPSSASFGFPCWRERSIELWLCFKGPLQLGSSLVSKLLVKSKFDPLNVMAKFNSWPKFQVHALLNGGQGQQQQCLAVNFLSEDKISIVTLHFCSPSPCSFDLLSFQIHRCSWISSFFHATPGNLRTFISH